MGLIPDPFHIDPILIEHLWIRDYEYEIKKNGIGYIRLKTVDKGWEIRDMGSILDQFQIHTDPILI